MAYPPDTPTIPAEDADEFLKIFKDFSLTEKQKELIVISKELNYLDDILLTFDRCGFDCGGMGDLSDKEKMDIIVHYIEVAVEGWNDAREAGVLKEMGG